LTNKIPSYRRPVFQALCEDKNLDVIVMLSQPVDRSAALELNSIRLHCTKSINIRYRTRHKSVGVDQYELLPIPLGLPYDLARYQPDLVVTGDLGVRTTFALAIARLLRIPIAVWSEEIISSSRGNSFFQKWLRRFLIPRIDYFLPWGTPAAEYLSYMGVAAHRMYQCAQAVHNDYWRREAERYDQYETKKILGLSGRVFLSVGRLVARKGLDRLLAAWGRIPRSVSVSCSLAIVGSGEEESRLQHMITELDLCNVFLFGHKSQDELPRFYAAADVFVFPSLVDVWGLVVNEALASGLPILASCHSGVGQGLIEGAEVGEVFDPLDIDSFAGMLLRWATGQLPSDRSIARRLVEKEDYSLSVRAFRNLAAEISK